MMHFRHHGNGKMVPDVKIILRGDSVIKKEMIAMLLAGGQGSRLGVLTSKARSETDHRWHTVSTDS